MKEHERGYQENKVPKEKEKEKRKDKLINK